MEKPFANKNGDNLDRKINFTESKFWKTILIHLAREVLEMLDISSL
jgi:hypothetical protein